MPEDNPYSSPAMPAAAQSGTPAQPGPAVALPLHWAVLNSWKDLFRSRNSHILRGYTQALRALGNDEPAPATVEEARQRFAETQPQAGPSEGERSIRERQMVVGARTIAAWNASWLTLLPLAVLAAIYRSEFAGKDHANPAFFPIVFLVLFPFFCILGLLVQSVFVRPFFGRIRLASENADDTRAQKSRLSHPVDYVPGGPTLRPG
jgi:hypothetical protein